VEQALEDIQRQMYERALAFMKEHTYSVDTLDELKELFETKRGFVLAGWCGSEACEHQVKLETKATSRNIPFIVDEHKSKCLVCEEQAKHTVVFARAY
jgi:prolyl-tRNA synthetase